MFQTVRSGALQKSISKCFLLLVGVQKLTGLAVGAGGMLFLYWLAAGGLEGSGKKSGSVGVDFIPFLS